jgi:hypothetical protein
MIFHKIISDKIASFFDNIYYNNLKKLYNENLGNIFIYNKFPIIKPEYFVYIQYYFIYTFFYYISNKNLFMYSISLHLTHISGLVYDNLILKYDYHPEHNIIYLKDNSYFLFMYLFYFKIIFYKIRFKKKIFILSIISIFYIIININNVYKERLECIKLKKDFKHKLNFLIISPDKIFIEKVIDYTKNFNYNNFLFFINFLIILYI